jgi:hypothetical protein
MDRISSSKQLTVHKHRCIFKKLLEENFVLSYQQKAFINYAVTIEKVANSWKNNLDFITVWTPPIKSTLITVTFSLSWREGKDEKILVKEDQLWKEKNRATQWSR